MSRRRSAASSGQLDLLRATPAGPDGLARFNGPAFDPAQDAGRLRKQIDRVREAMIDGQWRTLSEIEAITGDPQASISAQLRHLRKERFGSWIVNRRRRAPDAGTWQYQLRPG